MSLLKRKSNLCPVLIILTVFLVLMLLFLAYNSEEFAMITVSFTPNVSSISYSKEKDLIILIWMWPFGNRVDLNCALYNITGCVVTDNKALYSKANAVIFYHTDIHPDLHNLPKEPRPHFQKWVWWNMESPSNSERIYGLNNLFNLTCSYRRDSSIFIPYGSLERMTKEDELFTHAPEKERLVCWIASHWNPNNAAVKYFDKLKTHISVSTFGSAFGQSINKEQRVEIMKSCKFYLAFENSIHKDYITEEFFKPMELGTVPVVLGPPRWNYETHAPGDSFIHVDDFPSPKELAERLNYLDQNPEEYMTYFEWRNRFKSVNTVFEQQPCMVCQYLKVQQNFETFHNLMKWFWVRN